MEIDYKAIGQRIKIARIKKGITQEAVADLIDITPAHMSNVETGKTKVSLPTLIEIANALSVSVDVLLCDNVLASQNIFKGEAKDANSHFPRPAGPHFPASQGHIKRSALEIGRARGAPPC